VRARTDDEVARYRDERQIHVYGEGVPKPVSSFEEASFPGMQQLPPAWRVCLVGHACVRNP